MKENQVFYIIKRKEKNTLISTSDFELLPFISMKTHFLNFEVVFLLITNDQRVFQFFFYYYQYYVYAWLVNENDDGDYVCED